MDILVVRTTYMGNKNKILATFKCVIMQLASYLLESVSIFQICD